MADLVCPPEHTHGQNSTCRSLHHCKCDDCRRFAREYEFWRAGQLRRGRPLQVNAVGSQRRIRALQCLGWSMSAIAAHVGFSESWVGMLLRVKHVKPATAARVAELYDDLSMRLPETTTRDQKAAVTKARRYAERAGWAPPLAWDDEAIDDPDARPAEWKEAA